MTGAAEAPADVRGSVAGSPAGGGHTPDVVLAGIERLLSELAALPLEAESDAELAASVERLGKVERRIAAEQARRLRAVDARGAHQAVGAGSTTTMLTTRLGLSRAEANRRHATAVALGDLPETEAALAAGRIGSGQADVAAAKLPDLVRGVVAGRGARADGGQAGAEVDAAVRDLDRLAAREGASLDPRRLRKRLDAWADQQGHANLAAVERRAWHRRRAWLSQPKGPDRMARLTADLPATQAAKLRAAIDPLLRKDSADDSRTPEQRCADALATLAEQALDCGELPAVAAQRPHVLLIATADALQGRPGAQPALLDGHGPVSSETAKQLSCDAETTPIKIAPDGTLLDVGRARREPGRGLRVAVIARDRTCRGCGAAASRCEIHHIVHWSRGGRTDFANLVLLCWDCHTHVHHHGWTVTRHPDGAYACGPPEPPEPARPPEPPGGARPPSATELPTTSQATSRAGNPPAVTATGDARGAPGSTRHRTADRTTRAEPLRPARDPSLGDRALPRPGAR